MLRGEGAGGHMRLGSRHSHTLLVAEGQQHRGAKQQGQLHMWGCAPGPTRSWTKEPSSPRVGGGVAETGRRVDANKEGSCIELLDTDPLVPSGTLAPRLYFLMSPLGVFPNPGLH